MENEYDIYRPFDAEKHKAKYSNYLADSGGRDRRICHPVTSGESHRFSLREARIIPG